jgi:hypothetical protein
LLNGLLIAVTVVILAIMIIIIVGEY